MLEYRERNRNKHIISDNEVNAFAWAGYYAICSTILVNGKSYEVFHVTDTEIEFKEAFTMQTIFVSGFSLPR